MCIRDSGKLVQTEQIDFLTESEQKTIFHYDGDKIKKEVHYYNENDFVETIYEYDLKGQLIEVRKQDNEMVIHERKTFKYENEKTIETEYGQNNNVLMIEEIKKDEFGHEAEKLTI